MTSTAPFAIERGAGIAGSRAVFLDKDGTLVENVPYNVDPALVELAPAAGRALQALAEVGFRLVVVSNQPGVADGRFPEHALRSIERRIGELLAPCGVAIEAFYYCVHSPAAGCSCRKPRPGLVRRAAADLGIDLAASWLVGDILDDVEAGRRAGCRCALVSNGNETEWRYGELRIPDVAAPSLELAAHAIIAAEAVPVRHTEAAHALGRSC
jgi:histidinol-phosphate phosphatase family protein